MKLLTLIPSLISLLLGFYLFNRPLSAIASIGWIIALFIFIWGIQNLVAYLQNKQDRKIWQLLQSIVSIIFGFVLLGSSAFSLSRLVITFIAYWVLLIAILRIVSGYQLKQAGLGNQALYTGLAMLAVGLILLMGPIFTSVFIGKFLAFVFIIFGFTGLAVSFRM